MTDASLPALDSALDTTLMRGVLADACLLTRGRYEARECRIGHVRHKPGRSCLIGYELLLFDRWHETEVRQLLCGRVYGPADSESRWRKALGVDLSPASAVKPLTHLAAYDMVVWGFPNERKLRGVDALLDERRLVEEILPAVLGRRVTFARSELVRYIPEHGCTFRVDVDGLSLYAKVYPDDQGERTWRNMRELWGRSRRDLLVARPVAYQADTRTLWQEAISGVMAVEMAACARALAELHATSLPGLPAAADPRMELRSALERLKDFTTPQLLELAAEIERRLPADGASVTLHGDLHRKNFLLSGGRAALLDLDTLAAGHPLADIGSFFASLPPSAGAQAEFLSAYGSTFSERDVATYTALALITERASRAVTRRKAAPESAVPAILAAAEQLLARTASARDVMRRFAARVESVPGARLDVHYKTYRKQKSWCRSTATVSYQEGGVIRVQRFGGDEAAWVFRDDPVVPWIREAVDPAQVLRHLPVPADRVTVQLLNYRPENRSTARYEVEHQGARRTLYGKTYSDDRGVQVNQRLHDLYGIRSADFPVPEPLGYSEAIRTVWQAEFPGRCLHDLLDTAEAASLLRAAGQRLAFLHRSSVACPIRASRAEQCDELEKKTLKLATVVPELAPRMEILVSSLRHRMGQWNPVTPAVVHGDFHSRQLMVHGDAVALFDFDEIGGGDPLEDFGHFAANLASAGRDIPTCMRAIYEGYGAILPAEGVAWHTALQLVTRAYRGLLQLRPDFDARANRFLALAEEVLV